MKNTFWQPHLEGEKILLRPLAESDFEDLFQAASDPLIWEQHPEKNRYQTEVFQKFFEGALQSQGGLAVIDRSTQKIIGSSRYYQFDAEKKEIAIGYTFLARDYWGGAYNSELKKLMIEHAFQKADTLIFEIGESNIRSQTAIERIGAVRTAKANYNGIPHFIYQIKK